MANSVVIDGIRCASLEHLLILKLDAYADRKNSAKGDKDERDLIKIMCSLDIPNLDILETWLTEERSGLIENISKKK